ncbi:MAG TPA: hypothetical protein PLK19_16960 [Mycobacterium sp.]|nr:hypothetical protein [Mycobacterium sp.]
MTAIGSLFAAIGTPALPGARCRGRHHLFDDAAQGEPADTVEARHRQAIRLCQRCPALEPCQTWLDSLPPSRRPAGVVAGRINSRPPGRPKKESNGNV